MWMNVLVIGIIIIFVLWTSTQGFFSAILAFASTLVAGAVAFALWEPIYYLAFTAFDKNWGYDIGWGVTLILTFAIVRLLLQTLTDKACPANVFFSENVNWVGSGAVGLMTGILTAGMLIIGVQYIHGPDRILGYRGWKLDSDATVVRDDKLWVPVDEIVEFIYTQGSKGAMYSSNPMAEWQPRLAQQASLFRTSYGDGASRMGMRPEGMAAKRLIHVTVDDPAAVFPLLPGVVDPQTDRKLLNGDIYVISVEINNAAGDKDGKIRLSKGQVSLIAKLPDGEFYPIYPHAFYGKFDQARPEEYRFEFEVGDDYASSVGVGAEIKLSFEFALPSGSTLHHLMIRNARSDLSSLQREELTALEVLGLAWDGDL